MSHTSELATFPCLQRSRSSPPRSRPSTACGFTIGVTTVYRYIREGLDLLAALAPTLEQAMQIVAGKAYVIIEGSLLRIDAGRDGLRRRPAVLLREAQSPRSERAGHQ